MRKQKKIIEQAFEIREKITAKTVEPAVKDAVNDAINALDCGEFRVAEKKRNRWVVNEWLKKAVLLSFRIKEKAVISAGHTHFLIRSR